MVVPPPPEGEIVYAAEPTKESRNPLFDAIAFSVSEEATLTGPLYVVPCVHVPAPSPVGLLPSVV